MGVPAPHPYTRCADARSYHGTRDRPRPQHDTRSYHASGRITDVLAVNHGTGLAGACGYERSSERADNAIGSFILASVK